MTVIARLPDDERLWPIRLPSESGLGLLPAVRSLRSPAARNWYVGGAISLIWLLQPAQTVIEVASSPASAAAGVAIVVIYGIAFLVSAPLQWGLPAKSRLLVSAAVMALSLCLTPWLGLEVTALWTYVGVSVGMAALSWGITWPLIAVLGLLALLLDLLDHGWVEEVMWIPVIIVSVSMMMAAFAKIQATMRQLRATQQQVETLAAERERGRMARDIHDVLGHSLTVVTVKSELAGRLVDIDPVRAKAEMAAVEALARGALADVRATVAGVRSVTVSGELAGARAALEAADIRADLPSSTDDVPSDHRELAGWVVREGVTNVIRHAGASVCRVRLGAHTIEIADDGVGPTSPDGRSSMGLSGLRERVESAGGRLAIGRSELGGFRLTVTLP